MKHVLCVSTSQSVNPLYAWVLVRIIPNLWNQVTSLISGNRVKVKLRHKFTWYQIPISGPVPCLATDNELLGCGQSFWNVTERRSFFVLFHGTDAFSLFVNYFGKPEQKHSFWSVTICHPVHVVLTNKWLQYFEWFNDEFPEWLINSHLHPSSSIAWTQYQSVNKLQLGHFPPANVMPNPYNVQYYIHWNQCFI